MSKRKPTSELTDRNWDEEEEPEEAGTFCLANEDVLKNRTIRKAKRTIHAESSNSGNVFAGFALKTLASTSSKPLLSTGITMNFGSNLTVQSKTNGTAQNTPAANNGDSSDNPEYLSQLKLLNENILSWIQRHVEENPYCILTPSFKDYEKHLTNLEKKYGVQCSDNTQSKSEVVMTTASSASEKPFSFTFGASSSHLATSKVVSPEETAPSNQTAKVPEKSNSSGDDDETEPPKVEVREIKEDGAVYTKRCKLFYQKDKNWTDRGVGNLHLKPTENGRMQLIVRAETNLGNILLNILLTAAVPVKRQGNNNVFLICVPNPPLVSSEQSDVQPTPMLIRVKTKEDADELFAKLEKAKAST